MNKLADETMGNEMPRYYFDDSSHEPSRSDPELEFWTKRMVDKFVARGFVVAITHPILELNEDPDGHWQVVLRQPNEFMGRGFSGPTIKHCLEHHLDWNRP